MNCRIWYKGDGTVAVTHPVEKARLKDESDEDFLERVCVKAAKTTQDMLDAEKAKPIPNPDKIAKLENDVLVGLPFDDVDPITLPDRKDRMKWRGNKSQGLSVDNTVITLAEKRQAVEDALDTELAKSTPDTIKAMRLQRKLDKRDY